MTAFRWCCLFLLFSSYLFLLVWINFVSCVCFVCQNVIKIVLYKLLLSSLSLSRVALNSKWESNRFIWTFLLHQVLILSKFWLMSLMLTQTVKWTWEADSVSESDTQYYEYQIPTQFSNWGSVLSYVNETMLIFYSTFKLHEKKVVCARMRNESKWHICL